jgi:hypothetical protein
MAASTTDSEENVRAAVGLPPQPTPEEQAEQREAEEMQTQRRENGHRDPERSLNYQKKMNKLYAQKSAAERERDELRARLAQYEPAHGTENGNGHQEPPPQSAEPPRPELPAEQQPAQENYPVEVDPEFARQHQQHIENFQARLRANPDLQAELHKVADQAIKDGAQFPTELAFTAAQLENGPETLLYFLKNKEALARISAMEPVKAIEEIHKISHGLAFNAAQPDRRIPVSNAPPPIRALGGHSTRQATGLDDPNISQADFRRIRDQQERDWKRGVRR